MRAPVLALLALLTLHACGGVTTPAPAPSEDAGAPAALDADAPSSDAGDAAAPDADADGGCWRCIDGLWDMCATPPRRAPNAESCATCGMHCDDPNHPDG